MLGALRNLAADCLFTGQVRDGDRDIPFSYADSMLLTQLIFGAKDTAAQQEIMGTRHDPPLTFARAESFFIAREAAQKEARSIGQKKGGGLQVVGALQGGGGAGFRRGVQGTPGQGGGTQCGKCGFPKHSQAELCPAAEVECSACGKKGHYRRVCRSTVTQGARGGRGQARGRARGRGRGAPQVNHLEIGGVLVGQTGKGGPAIPKILQDFGTPSEIHPFEVDTGAEATVISPTTHKSHFGGSTLSQEGPGLQFLNESKCEGWLGSFNATLRLKGRSASGRIHVVRGITTDVIGRDFLYPLGIRIECQVDQSSTVATVKMDGDQVLKYYPDLAKEGMGTFKGEPHRMEPGAVPIATRLRPIPLFRRELACEEIRGMD